MPLLASIEHGAAIVRHRGEPGGYTDLRQLEAVPGLAGRVDGISAALTVGEA